MTYAPGLIVLKPGQGHRITALGNFHVTKAEGADTDGAWALVEQEILGANPPLHRHEHEDEAFYVLAGHLRVWVGDTEFAGGPGTFVLAPRGVPHTYARQPGETLKLLLLVSPAGFERMFDDIAELAETEQNDPAALGKLAAHYGVQILGPPPQ